MLGIYRFLHSGHILSLPQWRFTQAFNSLNTFHFRHHLHLWVRNKLLLEIQLWSRNQGWLLINLYSGTKFAMLTPNI